MIHFLKWCFLWTVSYNAWLYLLITLNVCLTKVCLVCFWVCLCLAIGIKRDWNLIRWAMFFLLYTSGENQGDIKKLNGSFLNILPVFNDENLLYMKYSFYTPFNVLISENKRELEQENVITECIGARKTNKSDSCEWIKDLLRQNHQIF